MGKCLLKIRPLFRFRKLMFGLALADVFLAVLFHYLWHLPFWYSLRGATNICAFACFFLVPFSKFEW